MSNSTAKIAAVENLSDALTAFGRKLDSEGIWVRKSRATVKEHEMEFGIVNQVHVADDMVSVESHARVCLFNKLNATTERWLMQTDTPMTGVKFPTDYRELDKWEFNTHTGRFSDVMYVGQTSAHDAWMCVDIQDDIMVVGLTVGTFKQMFERFCNASLVQQELAFRTWMCQKGQAVLQDLYTQQVDRHKAYAAEERRKLEKRLTTRTKVFVAGTVRLHDSLEMIAEACTDCPQDLTLGEGVNYYLVYMADHTAEHAHENNSNSLNAKSWENFVLGHAQQKRTGELAWAYRTVNKHKVPYAIWNPSAKLWELL